AAERAGPRRSPRRMRALRAVSSSRVDLLQSGRAPGEAVHQLARQRQFAQRLECVVWIGTAVVDRVEALDDRVEMRGAGRKPDAADARIEHRIALRDQAVQ